MNLDLCPVADSNFRCLTIYLPNQVKLQLNSNLNHLSQYGNVLKIYDNNIGSDTLFLTPVFTTSPTTPFSFKTATDTILTIGSSNIPASDHGILHFIVLNSYGSSVQLYVNNIKAIKYDENNFVHRFASSETSGFVDVKIENSSWSTSFKIRTYIDGPLNQGNCKATFPG